MLDHHEQALSLSLSRELERVLYRTTTTTSDRLIYQQRPSRHQPMYRPPLNEHTHTRAHTRPHTRAEPFDRWNAPKLYNKQPTNKRPNHQININHLHHRRYLSINQHIHRHPDNNVVSRENHTNTKYKYIDTSTSIQRIAIACVCARRTDTQTYTHIKKLSEIDDSI